MSASKPLSPPPSPRNTPSHARYLDYIGCHRARSEGNTLHDNELMEMHQKVSRDYLKVSRDQHYLKASRGYLEQKCPNTSQDYLPDVATFDDPCMDEAMVVTRRVTPQADADDIHHRLRRLFNRIKSTGHDLVKDRLLPQVNTISEMHDLSCEVIARHAATNKDTFAGFENECAILRSDAMAMEILNKKKKNPGASSSSMNQCDIDFIVLADLAAYFYVGGNRISMLRAAELWQMLLDDVREGPEYKLDFDQFESWLNQFHPQLLNGVTRLLLTTFATDEAFYKEFNMEEVMLDRLEARRRGGNHDSSARPKHSKACAFFLETCCLQAQSSSQEAKTSKARSKPNASVWPSSASYNRRV